MTVVVNKMKKIAVVIITDFIFLLHSTYAHAAPPIEQCPNDSVPTEEGFCKCDPSLCEKLEKPPCSYTLSITANGTDTPGQCCPTYSCTGCPNTTLINDLCPCAPNATLTPEGICKCIDPHKKLMNGVCVCDLNLCDLPPVCLKNHVPVVQNDDGCCPSYKCVKCPDDSYATENNDSAIEDKCVCYPCVEKQCQPNERVVVMQRGSGFPGECCDMYRCEIDTCDVQDRRYNDGEMWETADGQVCKCQKGISFCNKQETFRSCHKEGAVYKHDEWWMLDSCTNCTCDNGETKCIAHMCEVSEGRKDKPGCPPINCTRICPDGYKLNKKGCKSCKCNYTKYEDILSKYNVSTKMLMDILNDYFNERRIDKECDNATDYQPTNKTGNSVYASGAIGLLIGILVGMLIVVTVQWFSHRKKRSYNPNSARSTTYEKDPLFNNNTLEKI